MTEEAKFTVRLKFFIDEIETSIDEWVEQKAWTLQHTAREDLQQELARFTAVIKDIIPIK